MRTVHISAPNALNNKFEGVYGAVCKFIFSMADDDENYWILDTGINESILS